MKIKDQLLAGFPHNIRKDGSVFKALIANENENGVYETILSDAEKYSKDWTGTPDIYKQENEMLNLTAEFISFFERFTDETDDALKHRLAAIFVRNHDKSWGSLTNIKNVFQAYFPSAKLFLCENVNAYEETTEFYDGSLLKEGDFQTVENWTLSDASIRNADARFVKSYGIELNDSDASISQTVEFNVDPEIYTPIIGDTYELLAQTRYGDKNRAAYIKTYNEDAEIEPGVELSIPFYHVYFLHYFLNGNCNVIIKDNNNKYWDNTNKEWKEIEVKNTFETEDWNNINLWFNAEYNQTNIEIKFEGINGCYLDYVRLFEKQQHPSFAILAHFEGNSVDDALALATGHADTDAETHTEGEKIVIDGPEKFSNFGYYDGVFLTGVASGFAQDLYEDLLKYIKSTGVKAYIEILNRDSDNTEE